MFKIIEGKRGKIVIETDCMVESVIDDTGATSFILTDLNGLEKLAFEIQSLCMDIELRKIK